jgi:hypothetical protein
MNLLEFEFYLLNSPNKWGVSHSSPLQPLQLDFFRQRIISSCLGQRRPNLRRRLFFPISLSGNLPFFLTIILIAKATTQNPTRAMLMRMSMAKEGIYY